MADKNFLTEIIDADLAEGKISEIHTRFPPEPNGYLHIGSAKAIYINWSIANQYGGKFNLRLDDTNPAREGEEYVNSIIEDLHWLGADPNGGIFYGSDYFDKCYEYAEKLIMEGKAYVDDLTRDEMREYRGADAGKALMVSDILIVLAAAWRFGMGTGLYCILGLIGKSFVVDGAIENIRLRKVCTIVTANPQPILDFIIKELNRSATVEKAYGAYTHHELSVLVTVLTRRQALQLRNFLRENDPRSFITIVNSSEIIGKGFRSFN